METTSHKSVMFDEVITYLNDSPSSNGSGQRTVLDCTLGGGGHSEGLLKDDRTVLVGLDVDSKAIARCSDRLMHHQDRCLLLQGNFSDLTTIIENNAERIRSMSQAFEGDIQFDNILADLGFSSDQMDDPQRGMSFRSEAPLDMRLNQQQSLSADDVVNNYSFAKLKGVFVRGGVGVASAKLADEIVRRRPIKTTTELAGLCRDILQKKEQGKSRHPATVAFQAIRIEVNSELEVVKSFLDQVPKYLKPGGRLAIISFHSLEDKAVTRVMRSWEREQHLAGLPVRGELPRFGQVLTKKAVVPSDLEKEQNPRSRSARLRVFERCVSGGKNDIC